MELRAAALPSADTLKHEDLPISSMLDAVCIGLILVDTSGRMRACNSSARQLFEYRKSDLLGHQVTELFDFADRERFRQAIENCQKRPPGSIQHIMPEPNGRKKDGAPFPVECQLRMTQLEDEKLLVCSLRDISMRWRNEAAIKTKEEKLKLAEERLRTAQESGGIASWEWDIHTDTLSYYSDNMVAVYGVNEISEIHTLKSLLTRVHPDDRRETISLIESLKNGKTHSASIEYRLIENDNRTRWLCMNAGSIRDKNGQPVKITGTTFDISDRKYALEKLQESEHRFRSAFNQSAIPTLFVSVREGVTRVNAAMCRLCDYEETDLLKLNLFALVHPDDCDAARRQSRQFIRGTIDRLTTELRILTRDGETKWVTASIVSTTESQGRCKDAVVQLTDVTEEHNLTSRLVHEATHDSVTGLFNRREFENRLVTALHSEEHEEPDNVLVYLDLDQFKVINDTCGHAAGDELLRQLSMLLRNNLRRHDVIARLGGDEFGVFMAGCKMDQAEIVMRKIHALVNDFRFLWDGNSFNITMSSGLVAISEESGDMVEILKHADAACYAAKDAGRNRLHVFHPQDEELSRRSGEMQWVARINGALEEDRFQLYCQPIAPVTKQNKNSLYYEVLLRLRDEDGSLVPPGAFLPAAERYGLSNRLDKWVVNKSLEWLSENPEHVASLELCCINLSGHSLGDQGVLEYIEERIARSNVPASKICFEITETAAITNLGNATNFIKSLKKQGCLFALDDFGSGLSSFAYLKTLEVDILKIDGTFVREIVSDPVDQAMVRSINEIGKVLGKRTTAEFVENDAILQILKNIGVDRAQGYGISKPLPLADLVNPAS